MARAYTARRPGRSYPERRSKVTITYIDGEVKEFGLSASAHIASYLAREAAVSGMLVLRDDTAGTSACIPAAQIRHMEIEADDPVSSDMQPEPEEE